MGWSNYIIIDSLKLVIETNREVDDIEHYEKDALTKMINTEDDDCFVDDISTDMRDKKISDITIGDLTSLYNAHKNASIIIGMHCDKFLLYWLKTRRIDYKIKSEHGINIQQYNDNGYTILKRIFEMMEEQIE